MEKSEYSKFSPVELNEELRGIFYMIPQSSVENDMSLEIIPMDMDMARTVVQRDKSELYRSVSRKTRELLEFSYLTPATRSLVLREYWRYFRLGTNKEKIEENPLYDLLGLNSETGGIFNPDEAREMSRKLIKESEMRGVKFQTTVSGLATFVDDILVQARHEFVDKWGDEP